MRTHIWTPEPLDVPEEEKNDKGETIYKEDGVTPKIKVVKKDSPFKGIVIFKIPKYTERLEYIKECKIGKDEDPDAKRMVEIAIERITKVELTRIDDGMEFKTIEDLQYDKDGGSVLSSIANDIMGGVRLGENLIPD